MLKQKDYQFLADGNFSGLSFFFEIYAGREFIVFEFILLFIIPIITNLNSCIYRNNRFDVMIVSRIGYKNYFKQCFKQSIKDIWYYPVVINAITVLIIHFMCLPIIGKDIQYVANYFTNIGMLDLCLFTLFQIIGWSLLNYFCFLLSQLILNKYAYILSLGIYSVLSTILFSIIGSIIPFEIKWIFYYFFFIHIIMSWNNWNMVYRHRYFFYYNRYSLLYILFYFTVYLIKICFKGS